MKDKNLKRLQKEWYKKLADTGFEDLEYFDKDMEPQMWLKGNSKFSSLESEPVADNDAAELKFHTTRDYYIEATHKLQTETFESVEDRTVWEMHAEGTAVRAIGKEVGYSHPKVLRIINKYRKKFKL